MTYPRVSRLVAWHSKSVHGLPYPTHNVTSSVPRLHHSVSLMRYARRLGCAFGAAEPAATRPGHRSAGMPGVRRGVSSHMFVSRC
jgi:hypothetical protein